jgi:hypothetical protein
MLWYIANADTCMIEYHVNDTPRASLMFEDMRSPRDSDTCQKVPDDHPAIDFLAAGCWAFDFDQVIAATDLVAIAPVDLANVISNVPADATCLRDTDACHDATHQFFGSCLAGRCEPRCVTTLDCEVAATEVLREPPGTTARDCISVGTSHRNLAGVCTPRSH